MTLTYLLEAFQSSLVGNRIFTKLSLIGHSVVSLISCNLSWSHLSQWNRVWSTSSNSASQPTFRTVCFSYPVQEFCKTAMPRESLCQVKVGLPVLSLHPCFQIWNQGSSPPSFHGVVPPFLSFSHWSLFLFFLVVRVLSTKFSGFCLHI
jgi:hypothetical protein